MTLNRTEAIDPASVIRTIAYAHPVYTRRGPGRAGAPRRDQRPRPHPLLRRLLGLGLPRGRRARARTAPSRRRPRGGAGMTRQRALRGHRPPPPLRGARARAPPPREHGLPRPRRAARPARRPAARCRRLDHFGDRPRGRSRMPSASASGTGRADGPVRVLTHLRMLGHCFNPVSFFYSTTRRRDGSAPSWRRSPTRRGTSATPTCSRARTAAACSAAAMDKRHARVALLGHGPALRLARRRAGLDAVRAHREPSRTAERVFDATLNLRRVPLTAPLPLVAPPGATLRVLRAHLRARARAAS